MGPRPPRATYRVQLTPEFGFAAAADLADYLVELGVSHLYTSPYLQAAAGSTHGYDVVDHSRLNDELGGEEGHQRLCAALEEHHLGHVLDIVPNHMAIGSPRNRWWWDVLRHGPMSTYAAYFDVDWDPPEVKLQNTVLLPILDDHYGRVLEAGRIKLERDGDSVVVRYEDHVFPLTPPEPAVEDVERLNADVDAVDAILELQHYRLAYWRTADSELDYRRFFNIASLAGLRVEEPNVFEATHELVLNLVREGHVDGLRVDHVDGLRRPAAYLDQLAAETSGAWVVVEKIVEPGERLPPAWPVGGTTGYEFLNRTLGLFVDPAAEEPLTALYAELTGVTESWEDVSRSAREAVMATELSADLRRLTQLFVAVCERNRRYRDFTRPELRGALEAVIAAFPVYRTYVDVQTRSVADEDAQTVRRAVAEARGRRVDLDGDLFELLADVLLLQVDGGAAAELAMRFQQVTSPVMAKGVEDTAFYTYNRFVALNEVGGDPGRFGASVEEFHAANEEAQEQWPFGLLTTSTHDTKRSDDVRARLAVLSELPDAWAGEVRQWMARHARFQDEGRPGANAAYLLYQSLVGAWPLSTDRAVAYLEKASREAKVHTSWTSPDEAYERAARDFVGRLGSDADFGDELGALAHRLVRPGRVNSLAQTLLKLTSPGVTDIYQGSELWDLSLVDPDNRRPVDFSRRRALLRELEGSSAGDLWARDDEGSPKLHVTRAALGVRRRDPDSFGPAGAYAPIWASGEHRDRVVAFSRGERAVTIVPRLTASLDGRWADTSVELPRGHWRNELTGAAYRGGEKAAVGELLGQFPVALLTRT